VKLPERRIGDAAELDSMFVRQVADAFGSQALVDARRRQDHPGEWEVFTHGGRKGTDLDAEAWCVRMAELRDDHLATTHKA
jgi:cyclase